MRHLAPSCVFSALILASACASNDGQEMPGTDEPGNSGAAGDSPGSGGATGSPGSTSTGSGGTSNAAGSANTAGSGNGAGSANGGSMNIGAGGAGIGGSGPSGGAGAGGGGVVPVNCGAPAAPTGTPPALTQGQWKMITPPGICQGAHYGCMDIHTLPCNPSTLYLTTDVEGMWKSTDAGATWKKIGNLPEPVSPGVMEIDPRNPKSMYYIGGVRGASVGFWMTNDGGDTWTEPAGFTAKANNSVGGWVNDVYDVKADPADFKHVLLTFHSGWEFKGDAGVLETKDGGNTWIRHLPLAWGAGHSIWFLGNSTTWLLGAQYGGYWRTTDSGATWKQVSTQNMQHGGTSAYYSKSGVLYVGALSQVLRSTDNGVTFTMVAPHTSDGYYAVVGDGNFMYTQFGNTGGNGAGVPQPYVVSSESDGITWKPYNTQTFKDGPYRMTFDSANRIIYSANWNGGVWALKVMAP